MTSPLDRLRLRIPVIQAPMAGGTTTPALVAAVSTAGALGSFGSAYEEPATIRANVAAVRAKTSAPFAVNLFLDEGREASPFELARTRALLAPIRRRYGLNEEASPKPLPKLADQIAAVMDSAPAVFSSTFGAPEADTVRDAKARGILVVGTATSVVEAEILLARGVDAIVAQGSEAGGHRGTFAHTLEEGLVGVVPLVSMIANLSATPVIAAGGIMNGAAIAGLLAAGASHAQLGTAFICCPESGAPEAYRRALLSPRAARTTLTRAFSGRWARGIANAYTDQMAAVQNELAPYPALNGMTADMRRASAAANDPEAMSLWAGQGARLTRTLPAADLIAALEAEIAEAQARV